MIIINIIKMDKSEIIKMFDMMEKELNDENKMNIDAAWARKSYITPEQRNGRIGIDLEEFPDNELLTLIFNKNIKTGNLYLDIIVNADDFRVMLCSGDDNLVDINVEQDVLIDILTKLLYAIYRNKRCFFRYNGYTFIHQLSWKIH